MKQIHDVLSLQYFYMFQSILPHCSCRLLSSTVKVCSEKFSHSHKRTMCFLKETCAKSTFFASKEQNGDWQSEPPSRDDQKECWGFWEVQAFSRFGFGLSQNKTRHTQTFCFSFTHKPKIPRNYGVPSDETHLWCCPCSRRLMLLKVSCLSATANAQGFYWVTEYDHCLLHKYFKAFAPSMGVSGHGRGLKLFQTVGPTLQDPESTSWDPATLLIMQSVSKKTLEVR